MGTSNPLKQTEVSSLRNFSFVENIRPNCK